MKAAMHILSLSKLLSRSCMDGSPIPDLRMLVDFSDYSSSAQ